MIKMLTHDNCPQCIALKNYLDLGYGVHNDILKSLCEDNPDYFMELVENTISWAPQHLLPIMAKCQEIVR